MPFTFHKVISHAADDRQDRKKQDPNPTAHFQVFHPAGLLFNNSLPLEQSRILPITHIDLGNTHLGSFATNIVLNDAILRLILISTPKIARGSEVILQVLITDHYHLGIYAYRIRVTPQQLISQPGVPLF